MNHGFVANEGEFKDPVCGMTVDPQSASHKMEYEGKTYYFCCLPLYVLGLDSAPARAVLFEE